MSQPNLNLWFECKDDSLSVRRYRVREAMNDLFEVDLEVMSPSDDLDLEAYVGHKASFEIKTKTHRKLEGVVLSMALVRAEGAGLSAYRVVIVPRAWILNHRTNNRIFQELSIPAIVREVLQGAQVDFAYRLAEADFPKHEYRVQYEETDYAFISRLCEEAGMAFFFDEASMLTFADAPQNASARDEKVPYHPAKDDVQFGEAFDHVELRDEIRPARYTLRDHDFRRRPDFELFGKGVAEHDIESELELYHYRPGSTWILSADGGGDTPTADDRCTARASTDEGLARAKRKLESIRAGKLEVTLHGNTPDLSPGVVFKMTRHPHRELKDDRGLLVVASTLEGGVKEPWRATFVAHFADLPYRPPHKTRKPRVVGVQSAMVVGPSGEEIYTDEFGRVRVQFHWDREGERDEQSSCWVRVSQGWAGGGQGMIVLPRIGQEVFISYLDGDPDRPIVLGRCFNATAVVPHALPANKTQSAWRSQTSPQNGGYNEIMMEDKKGEELLQMHAQKDMQERVNNNATTSIGNSLDETVGNMKSLFVGSTQTAQIIGNCLKTVGQVYQVAIPPPPMAPGAASAGAAAAPLEFIEPSPESAVQPRASTSAPSAPPATGLTFGPPIGPATPPGGGGAAPGGGGAGSAPPPTSQTWQYNQGVLTANGSTIKLEKDITIETGGGINIKAKGEIRINGSIIHLNP